MLGPGDNADTGSRSVFVPSGVAAGNIDTGSGSVELIDSELRGDLRTTAGNVDLQGATVIAGDLLVRKSKCWGWGWGWGSDKKTRITIGAGVSVRGQIQIEREVDLWVHDSAQIGRVSGAEVQHFSAERP